MKIFPVVMSGDRGGPYAPLNGPFAPVHGFGIVTPTRFIGGVNGAPPDNAEGVQYGDYVVSIDEADIYLCIGVGPPLSWAKIGPAEIGLGSSGQFLRTDIFASGLEWVPAPTNIIARRLTDLSASNSTSEVTVATLSMTGGGFVQIGDVTRLVVRFDFLNNSGTSVTYTWRFKLGATTFPFSPTAIPNGTVRRKGFFVADVFHAGTTEQKLFAYMLTTAQGEAIGTLASAVSFVGGGVAAESYSGAAKPYVLTVQMTTAHAAADFVAKSSSLEILRSVA